MWCGKAEDAGGLSPATGRQRSPRPISVAELYRFILPPLPAPFSKKAQGIVFDAKRPRRIASGAFGIYRGVLTEKEPRPDIRQRMPAMPCPAARPAPAPSSSGCSSPAG